MDPETPELSTISAVEIVGEETDSPLSLNNDLKEEDSSSNSSTTTLLPEECEAKVEEKLISQSTDQVNDEELEYSSSPGDVETVNLLSSDNSDYSKVSQTVSTQLSSMRNPEASSTLSEEVIHEVTEEEKVSVSRTKSGEEAYHEIIKDINYEGGLTFPETGGMPTFGRIIYLPKRMEKMHEDRTKSFFRSGKKVADRTISVEYSFPKESEDSGNGNSDSPKTTINMQIEGMDFKTRSKSFKFVFVGNSGVGKTSLMNSFFKKVFSHKQTSTTESTFSHICINKGEIEIDVFDCPGHNDYILERKNTYLMTDVFLICFSVIDPNSFLNVELSWMNELKDRNARFLLIGTKADLRKDPKVLKKLKKSKQKPISFKQGFELSKRIGAENYFECSALTLSGLEDMFLECIRVVTDSPRDKADKEIDIRLRKKESRKGEAKGLNCCIV